MNLTLKIIKNNQTYTLSTPSLLEQNYNERIDNLSCKIVHLPNKINLKLKDKVIIQDTDNVIDDLYMIVSSYSITQDGLDNGTYSYDLQLCSETKDMEGYILPQLSITPLKNNERSIYWYLNKYNEDYGAKIRTYYEDLERYSYKSKWHYSQKVIDKFSTIKAPELQWNMSTFREVITDLMMVADCIPTLKNNEIDCIDLTETFSPIEHYNYLTWNNNLSTYASSLRMEMQNVMQTKIDGITNTTTTVECIPFTSNDYTMTSSNIVLKTKYPILKIKKLEMITYTSGAEIDRYTYLPTIKRKDFTNIDGNSLILEEQEYKTKELLYATQAYDPTKTGAYYSQYQNYCAYYVRGSNEILGFDNLTKKYGILNLTNSTIEWWIMINNELDIDYASNKQNYYQCYFIIEYETTTSQTLEVSKDDVINKHTIIDNQTNSWVDAYTQGNLEKQKANRTGNETIMLNQRFKLDDNFTPVEVGDFYVDDEGNKNIVYQVQKQIFKDHIDVNAYMTKNYVLRNSFTGIDSKVRTWKNATNEAFEKQVLKHYYCCFSKNNHREVSGAIPPSTADYFISPLKDTSVSPLTKASIIVRDSNSTTYPEVNYSYTLDLISRIMGDSIVFTFGFDNNTICAKYMNVEPNDIQITQSQSGATIYKRVEIKNSSLVQNTGIKMSNYVYVDNNYEAESFGISLCENIDLSEGQYTIKNNDNITLNNLSDLLYKECRLPKVSNNALQNVKIQSTIVNHKDNKEIPSFTIQYEFTSDTEDIYMTKEFIKQEKAIRTVSGNTPTVRIVDYVYNKEDREGTNTNWVINTTPISSSVVRITLSGSSIDLTNKALSIGYNNKNWIVINPKITGSASSYSFYLNLLSDKDLSIYNDDDFNEKVGEI